MSSTSRGETKRDRDGAIGLRYVGDGAALPDVPGRDLSADEIKDLAARKVATKAQLLASGLYEEATDKGDEKATRTGAGSGAESSP